MKVQSFTEILSSLPRVTQKSDNGQSGQNEHQQEQQRQKDDNEVEVDDEKVAKAIEDFASDESVLARGITAQRMGEGPGLKVVLKDGSGAVIRQLTGDEFVKLRESVSSGSSGRLIDRKL